MGSVQSWPTLYQKVFSHLKPGNGSFEQVEIDLEPRCDDGTLLNGPVVEWYEYVRDATRTVSRPIEYRHDTRHMLQRAGFIDIREEVIRAPFNEWPKDAHQKSIGRCYCGGLLEWLEALSMQPLTKAFGWSPAEVRSLIKAVFKAILMKRVHAYNNM